MASCSPPCHNWVQVEKTLLVSALKSLVESRLWTTVDGHFRPSYVRYLKRCMDKDFSDAAIEEWHIETKVKKWRRTCLFIVDLIDCVGFEWDTSENMVVIEDNVWAAFAQVHPQARVARDVQSPLFDGWRVCFIPLPKKPEE
ncbi:hypothetical protein RHMOL_Rhmol02G0213400 [Rhododendron molle]|uniref:Uncharacterized protein n=1 Tax=Rhododendron molle TaxID=49168 RepID=A0ACC0PSX4_RHOML|nr:hypothetical protein RHMOL_Rhmol02G0213400 [Rhododendron molle]